MLNTLVSIIIPVYNRPALVADTIKSVLLQTYDNWELILVDDGSTDNTLEVLNDFANKETRIKVYQRERLPKGPSTCKNIGAEKAKGDYFIFWDSDDLMAPWCVENRYTFLKENPELDFAFFQILEFEGNGRLELRCNIDGPGDNVEKLINFSHGASTQTAAWQRESFFKTGGWNNSNVGYEDTEIHLKAILAGFKYKWGNKIPDGFLRDDRLEDRLTVDAFSLQKGSKIITLFHNISPLLDEKSRKVFKKRSQSRILGKCFFLPFEDIKKVVNKSYNAGLLNSKEKKQWFLYFFFYRYVSRVPYLRRPFYFLMINKYKLDPLTRIVNFSEFIKEEFFKEVINLDEKTKNEFFKLLPEKIRVKVIT